jgi:hypothetical protein
LFCGVPANLRKGSISLEQMALHARFCAGNYQKTYKDPHQAVSSAAEDTAADTSLRDDKIGQVEHRISQAQIHPSLSFQPQGEIGCAPIRQLSQ